MLDIFRMLAEMNARKVTNAEVARRLQVSTGTIEHWKMERARPRLDKGVQFVLLYCEVVRPAEVQVFASSHAYKLVVTPAI